jgi:hypothetical protein
MLDCMVNMTCYDGGVRALLGKAGACEWVVGQLRAGRDRHGCVTLVGNLALRNEDNQRRLLQAGAVDALLAQVRAVL